MTTNYKPWLNSIVASAANALESLEKNDLIEFGLLVNGIEDDVKHLTELVNNDPNMQAAWEEDAKPKESKS